jgi:hypothetical protein
MKCPICKSFLYHKLIKDHFLYAEDYYQYDCRNPECIALSGLFYALKDLNNIIFYYSIKICIDNIWYSLSSSNKSDIETELYFVDNDIDDGSIFTIDISHKQILKLPVFFELNDYENLEEYELLVKRLLNLKVFS